MALSCGALILLLVGVADRFASPGALYERFTRVTRATSAGETATFLLPDDTHVTLAPGSRLRYQPEVFRDFPVREVFIDGEATFAVAPKRKWRTDFVVHTRSASVTAFDAGVTIHQYPNEPTADVSVADGWVLAMAADGHARPVAIGAGERRRIALDPNHGWTGLYRCSVEGFPGRPMTRSDGTFDPDAIRNMGCGAVDRR